MTTPAPLLPPRLCPLLVVVDVPSAIAFYVAALPARELARFTAADGTVTHVDLALLDADADALFSVMREAPAFGNHSALSLGGCPVVLQLSVGDLSAALSRFVDGGAALLAGPVDFCGERMARVRDPFGHLWLLTQELEALTPGEKQRRRDAFAATLRR